MLTDEEVKGKILFKMSRHGKYNESHTAIENLHKGFPGHEIGRVKSIVEQMMREGLLILKPTSYGEQVSINLEKVESVKFLIRKYREKYQNTLKIVESYKK